MAFSADEHIYEAHLPPRCFPANKEFVCLLRDHNPLPSPHTHVLWCKPREGGAPVPAWQDMLLVRALHLIPNNTRLVPINTTAGHPPGC